MLLTDGFSTRITIGSLSNVYFEEIEVQPPGVTLGKQIDLTTMRATTWRRQAPAKLKTLQPLELTVAYDPAIYAHILALIGINESITITFPDGTSPSTGSTLQFYGYLDGFTPGTNKEGARPDAKIKIVPTMMNPTTQAETDPVFTQGS